MLATAGVSRSAYAQAPTSFLAARAGWSQDEVLALRDGRPLEEDKIDALVNVVRDAAIRSGQVGDATWQGRRTAAGAASSSPRPSPSWP
jgi:hypothetical protein